MRSALVTGSSGHIGGHLVRELLAEGWTVCGLDRRRSSVVHPRFTPVVADVRDTHAVSDAAAGCDVLFHLAMVLWTGQEDPEEVRSVGHDGLTAVLAASRRHGCRLVHTSSAATVGETDHPSRPVDETTWNPRTVTPYTRTKTEVERRLYAEHPDAVALLPSMTIGPGDPGPTPSNARILAMGRRPRLPVWFDGGLDVVDARDVARTHRLAAEASVRGRFLITGHRLTMRELQVAIRRARGVGGVPRLHLPGPLLLAGARAAERVLPRLGRRPPVTSAQLGHRLTRLAWPDGRKARQELGHRARPLQETLRDLFEAGIVSG